MYFPQAQQYFGQDMRIVVRTSADPASLASPLANALNEIDPALPLADVRTLESVASAALETRRFLMWLIGAFGITALLLAAVGVYGVAAQNVGGRVREFGLRQALGATAFDILRSVLGGSIVLGAIGVTVGAALAWAVTRVLTSVLYDVDPLDPLTFVITAAVLLGMAVFGAWFPARRATRFDPATALRLE